MASAAEVPAGAGKAQPRWTAVIDRWIYVFMAGLFVATTLIGFVPDSLDKIALVEAGKRPPFPPVLHVHAVLMGSWLMLLLAQTVLMATGNARHHRKLGIASFLLAPAIVLSGIVLVPTIYGQLWDALASAPPGASEGVRRGLAIRADIMLLQLRAGILFTVFVVLALRARGRDAGFHKRMMILATLVPLPAAIDRIAWLPSTFPVSALSADLYTLLWLAPMLGWDLLRSGRIHRAYLVWFAWWIPATVAVQALWSTPWWQAVAPRLLGYG